jgi:hypothetical protein
MIWLCADMRRAPRLVDAGAVVRPAISNLS